MPGIRDKLKLYGFNNLTKALSFNIYDVCYAKSAREQKDYIAYIDEQYNSDRLTKILCDVTDMIGAQVLNISKQDYEPQGASVNILITEGDLPVSCIDPSCNHGIISGLGTESRQTATDADANAAGGCEGNSAGGDGAKAAGKGEADRPVGNGEADRPAGNGEADRPAGKGEANRPAGKSEADRPAGNREADRPAGNGEADRPTGKGEADRPVGNGEADRPACGGSALLHLDKSHVTVHTFPEYHPDYPISTFRVDIDVSTCGEISPLNALDYLIGSFDSDIITIDYRVRGFTRDVKGKKFYIDHDITSIQDYIDDKTLTRYDAIDVNVYQSNIFHTKMLIKEIELQNYLFKKDAYELPPKERLNITDSLRREMIEIFSGANIY